MGKVIWILLEIYGVFLKMVVKGYNLNCGLVNFFYDRMGSLRFLFYLKYVVFYLFMNSWMIVLLYFNYMVLFKVNKKYKVKIYFFVFEYVNKLNIK